MATDNHAHYSRIGFTVVIGIAAIVATLIYLGGVRDSRAEYLIETYYDHPVNGLSVGSPVTMFGVKLGEVREITFSDDTYSDLGASTDDLQRVSIVMAIDKKTFGFEYDEDEALLACLNAHIERGLRATVSTSGITGLSRMDLTIVENPPPAVRLGWTPRYPLVPPSPSLLESFSVAATKFMNRLKTMDFAGVWSNVQRTADASARTAENADALLESSREGLRSIVMDVSEASVLIKEMSATLKDNPSLLIRPSDPQPLPETAR